SGRSACGNNTAPGSGITGSCSGKVTDEDMVYCSGYLIRVGQRASVEGQWTKAVHQFMDRTPTCGVGPATIVLRRHRSHRPMRKLAQSRRVPAERVKLHRVCRSP